MKSQNKKMEKSDLIFDDVFFFENESDQIEIDAQVIMAKFLSEIQEVADNLGIKRNELAKKIGTSASYLTQLYRGHKMLNLPTIAKFQKALDIKFDISVENKIQAKAVIDEKNVAEFLDNWYFNSNRGEFLKITRNLTAPMNDENGYNYSPSNKVKKKIA
jgi:transcriptional regulator with XRE-family HTH domain